MALFVGWIKEVGKPWRPIAESDDADICQGRLDRYCRTRPVEDSIVLDDGVKPEGLRIDPRKR